MLIYPRQSGKNESVAQLPAYLLLLLSRSGGTIVYAAVGDGLGRGIRRLEERLDNPWTAGQVQKRSRPTGRAIGNCTVDFLSANPLAAARGETASHLLHFYVVKDTKSANIVLTWVSRDFQPSSNSFKTHPLANRHYKPPAINRTDAHPGWDWIG